MTPAERYAERFRDIDRRIVALAREIDLMTKPRLTFKDVADIVMVPALLVIALVMGFFWLPKCGTP